MRLEEKYNQSNLSELEVLFRSSVTTDVTFWGNRIVTVRGFEGSMKIDVLAADLIGMANPKDGRLASYERVAGKKLVGRVQQFYKDTDKKGSFLARIFLYIREFTFNIYTMRYFIDEGRLYQE